MHGEKPNRIYITGFMGSGKSTIGKILANVIGLDFLDLDAEIAASAGKTIPEIFQDLGEKGFREMEHAVLESAASQENIVFALGGGAFVQPENLALIQESGLSVYLRLSLDSLFRRLNRSKGRPLLFGADGSRLPEAELHDRIESLFLRRKPIYETADLVVDTDDLSVGKAVDKVADLLRVTFR